MKKISLTLLSVLLLSSAAMADDVLFKMAIISNTSLEPAAGSAVTLPASNAFFIGGSAKIVSSKTDGTDNVFANSALRLLDNYTLHLELSRPLQAGDVLHYKAVSADNDFYNIVVSKDEADGRTKGTVVIADEHAGEEQESGLVIPAAFAGSTDLYIWRGKNVEGKNRSHIVSLTITTSDPEVKYYDFEGETVETIFSPGKTLVNGLKLNATATSGNSNGIISQSSNGFTKMGYIIGEGAGRSLELPVTDPCTIEAWVIGTQAGRSLHISDDKSNNTNLKKWSLITSTADNYSKLTYCSFHYDFYEGFPENPILYINSGAGAWKIAAIRVIYDKIRPVADLAITPSALTVRTNTKENFTISTSSNVAITRDKTNESSSSTVKFSGFTNDDLATPSSPINGTVEGKVAGTYVMTLTQPASADYRAGYAELTINVADEVESDAAIATSAGNITDGNIWTSTVDPNMTFIEDGAGSETVRTTDKIAGGFTLTRNLSYTISVPTNKKITQVTITGYSNCYGTTDGAAKAVIRVAGKADSEQMNYIKENNSDPSQNEPTSIVYSSLNASTFTFTPVNYGIAAKLDIVVEESNKYPVTVLNGWASLCAPEDVTIPEGLTAYIGIAGSNGDEVLLQEITSGIIRSNSGVVLAGADGNYEMVATSGGSGKKGVLKYTTKRIANPNKATTYCLNGSVGAFQQYAGNYIPANKAYYTYEAPTSAPTPAPKRIPIRIVQHENTTTAIDNTEAFIGIDYSAPIYNLQGQQVQVTESGIYLQNGRKYLIMK